ncbi:MAG: hypothetical protein FJ299_15470, partial [Planctomycetes bacterium]|nr:hypothetical protein [Planctomycetota bacterium]
HGSAEGAGAQVWQGRWQALSPDGRRGWIEDGERLPGVRLEAELPGLAPREWIARLDGARYERAASSSASAPRDYGPQWVGTGRLRPAGCVRVAAPSDRPESTPWSDSRWRHLRAVLVERARALERELPAGFARALLFGDTHALDPELRDLFSRTGTLHLLAVSGTHLVLLCMLLFDPLGWLALRLWPRRRGIECALGLLRASVLFAYVPLALAQAPVTRSALALGLAGLAPLLALPARAPRALLDARRRADGASLWGLALACECWLDPLAALSASVQLSYLATLGLLCGCGPLRSLLLAWAAPLLERTRTSRLGHARPWWIGSAALLLARGAASACAASLAAVLATLPVAWSIFRECAPVGVLATPLCMPLFGLLLITLWSAVLVPALVPPAAYELPCQVLLELLVWFDRRPWTPLALPPRSPWLVALFVLGVFALARRATRGALAAPTPRRWLRLPTPALAAATLGAAVWLCAPRMRGDPRTLELEALDVGHGTCVALRAGHELALVFDAGSRERSGLAREALGPLLSSWEGMPLWVALSHRDHDHQAAMPWLAGRRAPRVWLGELPDEARALLPAGTQHVDVLTGLARIELPVRELDLELYLLRGRPDEGNEGSRSLLLRAGADWVLLCGDAEAEGLDALLELPLPSELRLLLWPHHGSDTDRLARLLARCRPREVWISAAREPAVARELSRRGVPWRSTHRDGPLRAELRAW